MEIGSAYVDLGVNLSQFSSGLQQAAGDLDKTIAQGNTALSTFATTTGTTLATVGQNAGTALGEPIKALSTAFVDVGTAATTGLGQVSTAATTSAGSMTTLSTATTAAVTPTQNLAQAGTDAGTSLGQEGTAAQTAATSLGTFGTAAADAAQKAAGLGTAAADIKNDKLPGVSAAATALQNPLGLLNTATTGINTAMTAGSTAIGSVKTAADLLKGSVDNLPGPFANFKGPLTDVLGSLGDLAGKGQPVVDALGGVSSTLSTVSGTVTGAASAFSGITTTLGTSAQAITGLIPGLGGMSEAIGAGTMALGPWGIAIGAAVAALALLGKWVYDNWEPIKTTLLYAWEGISELWNAAWTAVSGAMSSVWGAFKTVIDLIWGPYIKFFQAVWDFVGPYFIEIWNNAKEVLSAIWNAISGTFTAVWGSIKEYGLQVWHDLVDAFQKAFTWLQGLPGMDKILNLGKVWSDAKDASDGIKGLTTATTDGTNALKGMNDEVTKLQTLREAGTFSPDAIKLYNQALGEAKTAASDYTTAESALKTMRDSNKYDPTTVSNYKEAVAKLGTATGDLKTAEAALSSHRTSTGTPAVQAHKQAVDDLKQSTDNAKAAVKDWDILDAIDLQSKKDAKQAVDNLHQSLTDYGVIIKSFKDPTDGLNAANETMVERFLAVKQPVVDATTSLKGLSDQIGAMMGTGGGTIPGITADLDTQTTKVQALAGAYTTLGIQSPQALQDTVTAYGNAFNAINNDPNASAWMKNKAELTYMQAQRTQMIQNGIDVPPAFNKMIADLQTATDTNMPKLTSPWTQLGTDIGTAINSVAKGAIDSLFEGDGSFAEKGLKALKKLGESVVTDFTKPFTDEIGKLISGAINDLLGDKGFGGITSGLKNIGSAFTGGGGGGGGATGDLSQGFGFLGGGGGGGGGLGAAGSALSSGFSSVFGMVTGGIQAITGVVGLFQAAKQEDTMKSIEKSTRYTEIATIEQADSIWWSSKEAALRLITLEGVFWDFTIPFYSQVGTDLDAIATYITQYFSEWITQIKDKSWAIVDALNLMLPKLTTMGDVMTNTRDIAAAVLTEQKRSNALVEMGLRNINSSIVGSKSGVTVNVTASGVTPETAKSLGDTIADNLKTQLVGSGV